MTATDYSSGERFEYDYDQVGSRETYTATIDGATSVTTYTYDVANRLTDRVISDDRSYTYRWSAQGKMLAERTQGYDVRMFSYDVAGRTVEAAIFTQTTRFTYDGDGNRPAETIDKLSREHPVRWRTAAGRG